MKRAGSRFALPKWFHAPEGSEALLRELYDRRYEELAESPEEQDALPLNLAVDRALELLGDPVRDDDAWRSHGWMARALATEARIEVAKHFPGDPRPDRTLATLAAWLENAPLPRESTEIGLPSKPSTNRSLNEALAVLRSALALRADRSRARELLAAMVEDCVEGEVIVADPAERRAVLDWWLTELIPAAIQHRLPDHGWPRP